MRGKATGRYTPGRSGGGGEDESSRWLGTYGDAITLLMAFFVMLYAMSEVDAEKFKAFVEGLKVFGNEAVTASLLPDGGAIVGDGGVTPPSPDIPDVTTPPTAPRPAPPPPRGSDGPPLAGEIAREQLREIEKKLATALSTNGYEGLATYRYDSRGLVVSISSDDVLFASGSTEISHLGRDVMQTVADALQPYPNDIFVEGHTDDVPLDRAGYTNWNLSTDRAVAVLTMLYDVFGIAEERLGAAGFGEYRPLVPNDSPANRALNRRVDILIVAEGNNDG